MTEELCSGMVQFAHKQTFWGLVLMVRRTVPSDGFGDWVWCRWRKANFGDLILYAKMRERK